MSNDPCFCELAALAALDLLEEGDRQSLESCVAELPELEADLAEFQNTATALGYAAPPVEPPADLKARLFDRLNLPAPSSPSEALPALERDQSLTLMGRAKSMLRLARRSAAVLLGQSLVVRQQEVNWQPYRTAGVFVSPLHVDPLKREVTAIVKAVAGAHYPQHCHAGVEEIYMLEGDLVIGSEVYGIGDYIRSLPGSIHAPATTVGGCRFFVRTSLDDTFPEEVEGLAIAGNR